METRRHNLLGLSRDQLSDFVGQMGEPRYRGKQIYEWMYSKGVARFADMTDLSKAFRHRLEAAAKLEGLTLVARYTSSHDGTRKFLFALPDGLKIESVLIPPATAFKSIEATNDDEQKRLTLCVSSQVGCPLDCKFCATGTMGFLRNLTPGEIVDQVLEVRRLTGRTITNIVFMGMGEPMMNYDNVMGAAEIITNGIGIATGRITVSTAGWADRVRQMGDEKRRMKLAVSLHSADDETRTLLMPINKRFNLDDLMSAIEYYYRRTKQRVTYEYIFLDGINDSDKDVAGLVKLARRVSCKINVIPYHSIAFTSPSGLGASLRPSPRMEKIVGRLRAEDITVFVRSSAGEDIDAACGQLAIVTDRRAKTRTRVASRKRATSTIVSSLHSR